MSTGELGAEEFGEDEDMEQVLPLAEGAKKKKKKKKKAAPKIEETDNPLFPMGETRETGTGRLDGLQGGVKEELNEGLSQLQDFVSTTMKTEEETAQEKEVHLLHKKRMVATTFLGLQAWFVVCGIANIFIAYTTAHRTGYGHDHSMYAFMINGAFMIVLAAAGFFGALVRKSILPFHFYATAVLCNVLFWLSIYVLYREEAIEDYVKENYEHLNTLRSEPQTMQEMIDGTEILMDLISVMGFITIGTYIGSMFIILWLIGTTRTISSILVTVDGTFVCGGIIVMFLAIDAQSEDHAFSDLTKLIIYLAYPIGIMMFINGFLFMVTKHAALAQQEDIFEDHPKFAMTFAILLIGSGTGLGICAMLGMTQYYLVNENIIKKWNTDEFKMIRREYVSQLDAADALKGKFLELILGYLGLMAFHIQVALAGWYIFSKSRVEKLQQLKEQRTQRKNFGKDGSRRMRASQRHTKEVVIMVACFCITVFFGISWILASNEQNCDSAPVLDGFKASLIDTNTSATLHSTETTMEDKVDESPVTHVFDREFEVKVLCKMEMESDEVIGVEYRIFAADGALDHLLFKYDGATDLTHQEGAGAMVSAGGGLSNHAQYYVHSVVIDQGEIAHYTGDAILEIRVFDCRHRYKSRFRIHVEDFSG